MTKMRPDPSPKDLDAYFRSSESWAADKEASQRSTLRLAWIVAGVFGTIALAEAIAIVAMMPLKTVEPYTLLVDKQTGFVEALKPLERETIAPDRALTRSFLAQYILAREGFDGASLRNDYRKVALWSSGEARDRYISEMQATNPASPLAHLPRGAVIDVEVRGLSSLSNDSSLVRFSTIRTDPGGQPQPPQPWQAVVSWRFSGASMSEADRLTNPLGFQVTRYRRNAEIPIETSPVERGLPPAVAPQMIPSAAVVTTAPPMVSRPGPPAKP
ncbi:virB8 family protein [Novosphingobium sp.]|uniref:virB8 family protein n=1 Tax=Novosphingobium sp. TaxID=1874826 RepID=UPI003D112201